MSRIDDLIAEHCPEGVEVKTLGEVGAFIRGNGLQKKDLVQVGVGAIHYGQVFTTYGTSTAITKSFVAPTLAARLRRAKPGDLVIATTSENDEDVCKAVAWIGEDEIAISGDACIYSHTMDPLYVAHYFQTDAFQSQKRRFISGTKVKRVSGTNIARIKIPVPPPAVQREIAGILGKMEMLEAELEAELEYRSRQYAHYRDSLLTSGNADCEWRTLVEVASEFGRGKSKHRPRNDPRLYGGPYPFIQTGDIRNSSHLITQHSQTYSEEGLAQSKLWPRGTVCITIAANIAETGVLDFDACFPDSVVGLVTDPEKTSPDYVEYLLQSFKSTLASRGQGSAQENINLATFEHARFPFPPLNEQVRIVAILDKFDALVNDLSIGLPAEIKARRQQYEYYRDRLLTFGELAA